jgi:hypothetical protein
LCRQPPAGTVSDDPGDDFGGLGAPGTTSFPVVIPTGTTLFRVGLFDGETDGADDLDLYVYQGTTLIGSSGGTTAAERVSFNGQPGSGPIPLTVVVHGFETDGPEFQLHAVYVECWNRCDWKHGGRRACAATQGATGQIGLTFSFGGAHSLSRHSALHKGEHPGNDRCQRQHALTSNADIEARPGYPSGFVFGFRPTRPRSGLSPARADTESNGHGGRGSRRSRPHTQDDAPSRNQRLRVLHLRFGTAERTVSPVTRCAL